MSNANQNPIAHSLELARLALAEIEKSGAPATPKTYEMWYAHFAGENPDLSQELQKTIDEKGELTTDVTEELYDRHFANMKMNDAVIDAAGQVENQMNDIVQVLTDSGKSTSAYGDVLAGASGQLGQFQEEGPVRQLLDGILRATRAMETQNKKLEEKLSDSTSEIIQLRKSVENIRTEALTDSLTGVANRKCFDDTLRNYISEAETTSEPLCLVMADVDHFKAFNDKWGHQTGDQVLRLVAATMNSNLKGRDIVARYGGEEFAVILPQTELEHAVKLANEIRVAVEAKRLKKRTTNEDLGAITVSLGVSLFKAEDTPATMIERADQCLYAAKRAGRNRTISEDDLAKIEAAA